MNNEEPLVSIGLPTYNRPDFLRQTLESLTVQSYKNIEVLVSNDCSPNSETQQTIDSFAEKDSRVVPFFQKKNLRPVNNSIFTLKKAKGKYFFWAGEDDLWHEDFVKVGVELLEQNSQFDAWRSSMESVDQNGNHLRQCTGFSRFTSTDDKKKDLIHYLKDPEINGKANIIHSIFKTDTLLKALDYYFIDNENWGADCCFVLAFLARHKLLGTDDVLFYKRTYMPENKINKLEQIAADPSKFIFPFKKSIRYIYEHYKATKGTPYCGLTVLVMITRLPIAMRNRLAGKFRSITRKFSTHRS